MEELPLLASFLPEVRESLEGEQITVYCSGRGWASGESRVFVSVATGFTLCCVCGKRIFTSLLKYTFL